MATTKKDVSDFINANTDSVLTTEEIAKLDEMLTPELAEILIKLVGDVSILTHVRDNAPN
jgi:hypothetical protein